MKRIWEDKKVLVACVQFAGFDFRAHLDSMIQFVIDGTDPIQKGNIVIHRNPNMPLDFQRSIIQEMAVQGGYTHLFMYDTDMIMRFSDLEKLLERNVACVSGTYFMGGSGQNRMFPCVSCGLNGQYVTREEISRAARMDHLIETNTVGCGALLVTVDLLKRVGSGAFKDEWRIAGDVRTFKGEDVFFAEAVRRAGEKCYIDPKVIVPHIKTMYVDFDIFTEDGQRILTPQS